MTIRRAPYNIYTTYATYTAQALDDAAQLARQGKMIGVAFAGVDENRQPILRVAGYFRHRPREGHWAVSLLQQQLLHDNGA